MIYILTVASLKFGLDQLAKLGFSQCYLFYIDSKLSTNKTKIIIHSRRRYLLLPFYSLSFNHTAPFSFAKSYFHLNDRLTFYILPQTFVSLVFLFTPLPLHFTIKLLLRTQKIRQIIRPTHIYRYTIGLYFCNKEPETKLKSKDFALGYNPFVLWKLRSVFV